jgi:hypothetical protein
MSAALDATQDDIATEIANNKRCYRQAIEALRPNAGK